MNKIYFLYCDLSRYSTKHKSGFVGKKQAYNIDECLKKQPNGIWKMKTTPVTTWAFAFSSLKEALKIKNEFNLHCNVLCLDQSYIKY